MALHENAQSIHKAAFVQSVDPGPVGADKCWIDTSVGPPFQIKVRNAANTAWENVGGVGNMTNPMSQSDDIIVAGASGTPTRLAAPTVDDRFLGRVGGSFGYHPVGAGGGSGATTQIAKTVLATAAPTIDFPTIPNTYTDLLLTFIGRCDQATNQGISLRLNADAGTNYDRQWQATSGASVSANTQTAATQLDFGIVPGTGVAAGIANDSILRFLNYAQTTFWKKLFVEELRSLGTASGNQVIGLNLAQWRSTAAISRITLSVSAGNFVAGTTATLWGVL